MENRKLTGMKSWKNKEWKKKLGAGAQICKPSYLEAKIERIMVWGQPSNKVSKTYLNQ
jgi:hypothetical protein